MQNRIVYELEFKLNVVKEYLRGERKKLRESHSTESLMDRVKEKEIWIDVFFLHTNSAVHRDLGAVRDGDLVIILSKSGETSESVYLYEQLKMRNVTVRVMSYNGDSTLCREDSKKLVLYLEHEGDKWDLVPNNSNIGFLLVLQSVAMELADRLDVGIDVFKKNHPGGYNRENTFWDVRWYGNVAIIEFSKNLVDRP